MTSGPIQYNYLLIHLPLNLHQSPNNDITKLSINIGLIVHVRNLSAQMSTRATECILVKPHEPKCAYFGSEHSINQNSERCSAIVLGFFWFSVCLCS